VAVVSHPGDKLADRWHPAQVVCEIHDEEVLLQKGGRLFRQHPTKVRPLKPEMPATMEKDDSIPELDFERRKPADRLEDDAPPEVLNLEDPPSPPSQPQNPPGGDGENWDWEPHVDWDNYLGQQQGVLQPLQQGAQEPEQVNEDPQDLASQQEPGSVAARVRDQPRERISMMHRTTASSQKQNVSGRHFTKRAHGILVWEMSMQQLSTLVRSVQCSLHVWHMEQSKHKRNPMNQLQSTGRLPFATPK